MDVATFRQDYPEFADVAAYPDAAVLRWVTLAEKLLPECRWADLWPLGTELFTAHYLVTGARAMKAAASGVGLGGTGAPISSKSVDKVSVSYDNALVSLEDAGFWGTTGYGIQFLQWARLVGMGGLQL